MKEECARCSQCSARLDGEDSDLVSSRGIIVPVERQQNMYVHLRPIDGFQRQAEDLVDSVLSEA